MDKFRNKERKKNKHSKEVQKNTLNNYFTLTKTDELQHQGKLKRKISDLCSPALHFESTKPLGKSELTLNYKNDSQTTCKAHVLRESFEGAKLHSKDESVFEKSPEIARSPRKKLNSSQANENKVIAQVNSTIQKTITFTGKTDKFKNVRQSSGLFVTDQTDGEDPLLFKDDEVEIQFRSPKKVKRKEFQEQIEKNSCKDQIPDIDDKIVYKDEEVEIQFQSPKRIKRQELHRESEIVESCSYLERGHRYSINDRLNNPPKAKFLTFENAIQLPSEPITKPAFADDVCLQSSRKIEGTSFKKAIQALYVEPKHEHNSDKQSERGTENMVVPPNELELFGNKELFVLLDSDISTWKSHTLSVANLYLSLEVYFRGDILRVLFYYILNGPDDNVMIDLKHILLRHFVLHPSELEVLRCSYRNLLFVAYTGNNYDFPKNITDEGIWYHVMEKLVTLYKLDKCTDGELESESEEKEEGNSEESLEPVTFELLEKRYYNHEPLLDKESERAMKTLDYIANFDWNEEEDSTLKRTEELKRLNVTLELIIQLLRQDFNHCISKLKQQTSEDHSDQGESKPLVQYLTNDDFYSKLLKIYFKTKDEELWILLSQLFELMAEQTRIFYADSRTHWNFPVIKENTIQFADQYLSLLKNYTWEPSEELRRLRMLGPPWFQQRVIMALVSHRLNLKVTFDLKGLIDLLHLKITNKKNEEVSMDKGLTMKKCTVKVIDFKSSAAAKNVQRLLKKKNRYGETHLHTLCKQKRADLAKLEQFLALPEVDLNAADHFGWTPLHEAINSESQSTEKTRLLLMHQPSIGQKPLDVGAQNHDGVTPLLEAVTNGNLDICRLLVEKGGYSLLFRYDCRGITPFDLAEENSDIALYFRQTVEAKEKLDYSTKSLLGLEDRSIELLKLACDASMANHETLKLKKLLKTDKSLLDLKSVDEMVCDKDVLLLYKEDQKQFSRLRKLLQNLYQNENNPPSVFLWNHHINPTRLKAKQVKSMVQTHYQGLYFQPDDLEEDQE